MPEPSVLGSNIKQLRMKNGLDQDALGAASGVPQGTISNLERGAQRDATTATVKALAGALGVSVDELLDPDAGRRDLSPDVRAHLRTGIRDVRRRLEAMEATLESAVPVHVLDAHLLALAGHMEGVGT